MVEVAKIFLEFLIVFVIVYLFYRLFSIKKLKKFNRKNAPLNLKYLMVKYKLDVVKIGYKKIENQLMMVDSLIVAFIFTVTKLVDNIYIRLLVAFILVFPVFAGLYHLIAKHYQKKESM